MNNLSPIRLRFFLFSIILLTSLSAKSQTKTSEKLISKKVIATENYQNKSTTKSTPKTLAVSNSQQSKLSKNTIYFVNNKVISTDSLKAIPKTSIVSFYIIKRDTIVNSRRFDTQFFVKVTTNSVKK